MHFRILFILLFLFSFSSNYTFATEQLPDLIVVGKDTGWLLIYPLEIYFEINGNTLISEENKDYNTGLHRGYIATWQLENDSLFLIRIQKSTANIDSIEVDLKKILGTERVFANWVTRYILSYRSYFTI